MAATRRRNRRRVTSRRRRNTTVVRRANARRVTRRRRRRVLNPRRRTRRVNRRRTSRRMVARRRRRNPSLFGIRSSTQIAQAVLGGLVGVAASKFIPSVIPVNIGGGNIVRVLVSGASAALSGYLARQFMGSSTFADAVLFGGLMQTASVALNAFLPGAAQYVALSGGRGMGDLVNTAGFVVPQNPMLAPAYAPVEMNGLRRSFGVAF